MIDLIKTATLAGAYENKPLIDVPKTYTFTPQQLYVFTTLINDEGNRIITKLRNDIHQCEGKTRQLRPLNTSST
jgi:hypothetical protein